MHIIGLDDIARAAPVAPVVPAGLGVMDRAAEFAAVDKTLQRPEARADAKLSGCGLDWAVPCPRR